MAVTPAYIQNTSAEDRVRRWAVEPAERGSLRTGCWRVWHSWLHYASLGPHSLHKMRPCSRPYRVEL